MICNYCNLCILFDKTAEHISWIEHYNFKNFFKTADFRIPGDQLISGSIHSTAIANRTKQFTVRKTSNLRKLLAQRPRTVRQDLTVPGNSCLQDCYSSMIVPGEYKNPRQFTGRKTVNPRQLLALRSSTVRQDCHSPEITDSKNMYCPARAEKLQQLDLLADSRLVHD